MRIIQPLGEVVVVQTPRRRTLRGVCVHRAIMCGLSGKVASTPCQLPVAHNKPAYVTVRQGMLADNGDTAAKKGGKARWRNESPASL